MLSRGRQTQLACRFPDKAHSDPAPPSQFRVACPAVAKAAASSTVGRPRITRLFTAVVSWLALAGGLAAEDWTRFRGPNGNGTSVAVLPSTWDADDYQLQIDLPGVGHSSPVFWKDRLFLTSGDEASGTRFTLCLQAETGKLLWRSDFESTTHRKHQLNSFASATPAVDADRVYLFWTTPEEFTVQALDHEGKEQWRSTLGPFRAGHGSGASPMLYKDRVVVAHEHGGESALLALDKATGAVRWKTPRETDVAYSTPCLYEAEGRPAELIFTNWKQGITAVDPDTGRINWSIEVFDMRHTETSIGSPIVHGDLVLGTCGYLGYAAQTVAVRPDRTAEGGVKEVYRVDRGAPLTTTPVIAHGLLFCWADDGIVTCVDAATGELAWRNRVGGTYYGSPIVAGEHVYCMSTAGECVTIKAAREFELVARNPLGDPSHATPAVHRGRLYLRTFSKLLVLEPAAAP